MRISDWSSDVCSSDLHWFAYTNLDLAIAPATSREIDIIIVAEDRILIVDLKDWKGPIESRDGRWYNNGQDNGPSPVKKIAQNEIGRAHVELQSLMRISYAVFCLKKKKTKTTEYQ